jgi:hypothetical protein
MSSSPHTPGQTDPQTQPIYGLLGEFDNPDGLVAAAEQVRKAGYTRWDVHTPFPVHGLDDAMGIRATRLPWIVLAAGLSGAGLAVLLQWWTNAVDYTFIISGKPYFSLPANIPVTFELTVLFAAVTAFVGMLALNGLPQLYHPLFGNDRFRRATSDRFFVVIEADDPQFDPRRTRDLLVSLGAEVSEARLE